MSNAEISRRLARLERKLYVGGRPSEGEDVLCDIAAAALVNAREELEPVAARLAATERRLHAAFQRALDALALTDRRLERLQARLDALDDAGQDGASRPRH